MQSSVAAIRRGRLQAHFVTAHGHHRNRGYGVSGSIRGRMVPVARPIRRGAGSDALAELRRGDGITWARPSIPTRRENASPTPAWRD